jgi:hypothetical protein
MGGAKLPGIVYSHGVWRIESVNQTTNLREALPFHRPAGTRVTFLQWLTAFSQLASEINFSNSPLVSRVAMAFLDESFVLGRTRLSSCNHLTQKRRAWEYLQICSTVGALQDVERAHVKVARFTGRQSRIRMNMRALNRRRFPNTHISEVNLSFCNPIYTGRNFSQALIEPGLQLSKDRMNRQILANATPARHFCFRQKDLLSETQTDRNEECFDLKAIEMRLQAKSRLRFLIGQSRLNDRVQITGINPNRSFMAFVAVAEGDATVQEAFDIVDRWRRRGAAFRLNGHSLNKRDLTDGYISEERAKFVIHIDTDTLRRRRVQTCRLNLRPLNTTGLRMSVDRIRPLRIGKARLNEGGFRYAMPAIQWLIRQKDQHSFGQQRFESAVNKYKITQWPV